MNWIFLTLTGSLLVAMAAIYSRFSLKHESKNSDIIVMLWGYFAALMFTAPAIISGTVQFNPIVAAVGVIGALCYLIAFHYYFRSLGHAEVNRIVPIVSINPLFILLGATILFGEVYRSSQYLGMLLILLGIMINAWDQQKHHLINRRAICWATLAALFFAIKSLGAKWLGLLEFQPLNILFWIGFPLLFFNLFFTAKVLRQIKSSSKKLDWRAWANLSLNASLEASATLLFTAAISIGPAAIVAFLDRLEILFVFIISNFLDFFRPQLLREKFIKEAFFQKLAAVIIILIGSYFLV